MLCVTPLQIKAHISICWVCSDEVDLCVCSTSFSFSVPWVLLANTTSVPCTIALYVEMSRQGFSLQ